MSKVRGHLVDMPLDFLIVSALNMDQARMLTPQEEKWMTEGVRTDLYTDQADLAELPLGQPPHTRTVCLAE